MCVAAVLIVLLCTIWFVCMHSLLVPSLCQRYDSMSNKVYENPASTEDLMELVKFVSEASQETVYKLADEVKEAGRRLKFLLDYAAFPGG